MDKKPNYYGRSLVKGVATFAGLKNNFKLWNNLIFYEETYTFLDQRLKK